MHSQRILIIGGGFAGVNAAAGAVETLGPAQERVSVELISPDPYWVIKPRLYERDLSGARVPLDPVLKPLGVVRHEASAAAIDAGKRRVTLDDGSTLEYDQLVLAAGSRLALPDAPNVYCADSYAQAVELRAAVGRLHGSSFRAVVVGGGFTGIELASELAADAQVTLVAAGEVKCHAATGSGDRRACWNGPVSNDVRDEAMSARVEAVWAASGAFAVALFACGLLFGDLLATTNFPALNATPSDLREYFLRNGSEVRALSLFHLLAAAALAAFASYLYARLRSAGIRVAALALAGGIIAAAFLAMSALCYRVLAEHSVASDPALAHALVVLSYLAGGPAIEVPLALTAGAFAAAIRHERTLPGWLCWLSMVAAVLGVASATTMLGPTNNGSLAYGVLLLAAVLLFAWLVASSLVLVRRARRPR